MWHTCYNKCEKICFHLQNHWQRTINHNHFIVFLTPSNPLFIQWRQNRNLAYIFHNFYAHCAPNLLKHKMISLSTIKAWLCKCMSLQDCLNKVCAPSEKSFRSLLKATCAKKISHIGVRRVQWFFNKIYSTSVVRKIRFK